MNNPIADLWNNRWLELICRWAVGSLFVYASLHKIANPGDFAEIICGYMLLPDFSINTLAVVLPFLELICGLALILGFYPRSAALLINMMLLVFATVLSINLIRGIAFDCGCISFGEDSRDSVISLIVRDVLLMAPGFLIAFYGKTRIGCLRQTGPIFTGGKAA